MAYLCDHCGARLDPGEKCACEEEKYVYVPKFHPIHFKRKDGKYIITGLGTRPMSFDTLSFALLILRSLARNNWTTEKGEGGSIIRRPIAR